MKFKTFRLMMVGVVGVAGIGLIATVSTCCKKDESASAPSKTEKPAEKPAGKPAEKPAKAEEPKAAPEPKPAEPKGDGLALRPMDKEVLDKLSAAASGDKLKDAFPGKPYKVNLYKENGATRFNRVKIDLDRDEKWDEKWSVEDDAGQEVVKRQVAPSDDEKYTDEYRLMAGAWVQKKK